jgi:hypothetical protein
MQLHIDAPLMPTGRTYAPPDSEATATKDLREDTTFRKNCNSARQTTSLSNLQQSYCHGQTS